jgi:hypothetical protein
VSLAVPSSWVAVNFAEQSLQDAIKKIGLHAAQLEVLPKPDRACFVTLTAAGQVPRDVLAHIARSVRYP